MKWLDFHIVPWVFESSMSQGLGWSLYLNSGAQVFKKDPWQLPVREPFVSENIVMIQALILHLLGDIGKELLIILSLSTPL